MRLRFLAAFLATLLIGIVGCGGGSNDQGGKIVRGNGGDRNTPGEAATDGQIAGRENEQQPTQDFEDFDPDNFDDSTTIDKQWFPLKPWTRIVLEGTSVADEGDTEAHRVVFTITDLTKVIDGVQTVVCWERDFVDGDLEEAEIVFFAQDKHGAVWHFGEYPEEYDEGEIIASPGWLHGFDDCRAGIHMPANPELGDPSFAQGWAPKVPWTDRAVVHKTGLKVEVPYDSFENVIVFDEYNREEPGSHQLKYYARGVGNIKVGFIDKDDLSEKLELVKVEKLDAKEMAEARDAAWKLETSAAERLPDVFGKAKPSERQFAVAL